MNTKLKKELSVLPFLLSVLLNITNLSTIVQNEYLDGFYIEDPVSGVAVRRQTRHMYPHQFDTHYAGIKDDYMDFNEPASDALAVVKDALSRPITPLNYTVRMLQNSVHSGPVAVLNPISHNPSNVRTPNNDFTRIIPNSHLTNSLTGLVASSNHQNINERENDAVIAQNMKGKASNTSEKILVKFDKKNGNSNRPLSKKIKSYVAVNKMENKELKWTDYLNNPTPEYKFHKRSIEKDSPKLMVINKLKFY